MRTLADVQDPVSLRRRFWAKVDPDVLPHECWDWQGARSTSGYGMISITHAGHGAQHRYAATHVAWLLAHHGMPPQGLILRHTCDNPRCVNLGHLDLGTHRDNALDREERGRGNRRSIPGAINPHARLSPDDVRFIRAQPARWGLATQLARQFGVSDRAIAGIRNGKLWASLPD
ncbi:HNH endonuclease [Deinococcus sp. MIMF12]|uniref:HNH endonuclease n=1 Tax=Deinococcus rhizophilus TaxID=3049544 RepID=A0ABT7JFJ1_9DEIO|nr:HNH endonuclease [Deinococcus rhizophilus]MDL2343706.1 HNH endonuclease [Deinococcus rhizophilus]